MAIAGDAIALFGAKCRRWGCQDCGRKNARNLARRIVATKATRFVTLTCRPDSSRTAAEQLDMMNAAWRALWKRIKRQHGERAIGYVKIIELTKSGNPHLHIALKAPYIPQRWLSASWRELTGSPIVDIRVIKTEAGMAKYLAKYLTKAHHGVRQRRRWSQSKSFLPPLETEPPEPGELPLAYRFTRTHTEDIASGLIAMGYIAIGSVYVLAQNWPAAPS